MNSFSSTYHSKISITVTIRSVVLFLLTALTIFNLQAQSTSNDSLCLTKNELRLSQLINQFRVQNKLPEIPLSKSLCFVAKTHVYDLQTNHPDTSICNTASWSNKGNWTPCCYNKYVVNNDWMWDKPKELTSYKYRGYEISYFEEGIVNEDSLFYLWKGTREVLEMLLNKGFHADKKWLAMGVGISDNYASVWLGQRTDIQGKPSICKSDSKSNKVIAKEKSNNSGSTNKTGKYYLIYGSFSQKSDAEEEIKKYQASGLKKAQLIINGEKIRVALGEYETIKEAMAAKEKFKDKYKDAWILKN